MEQHRLSPGKLLDEKGRLIEAGYAHALVREYDRRAVRAGKHRIKEWDYYLIFNEHYGVALTIDDNAYMGLVSATFLDFTVPTEQTVSPMFWFPWGKTGFPATSENGDIEKSVPGASFSFTHVAGGRRLTASLDKFLGEATFSCDLLLTDEPRDSMVIATPFAEKETHFYYNQKIVGMRAAGTVSIGGKAYAFDPSDSFGLLDWGRGVWTYKNTWYWGAGMGMAGGHKVGWNLGYGFGDTSHATENMVFYDGVAHKLSDVDFGIPMKDGKEDYMAPWRYTSSDGRFTGVFTPIIDRASKTDVLVICSDQHQVFGRMNGTIRLDDGTEIALDNVMCFAEKVRNKW